MTKDKFLKKVKDAGIVGAGGAGFPAHIKLDSKVEYVIINGAECEPFLQVDQQIMAFFPDKIIKGVKHIIKATSAKKGIIALKSKYKNAINSLKSILKNEKNIEIFLLNNFYPAGDEQTLTYTVLKRVIPEGGIPLQVGAVVTNVGTVYNIYNAIENDKNVTDKFVTVTGEVNSPGTFLVPIGTPFTELIRLAGGVKIKKYQAISGGPMMGKIIDEKNEYVSKTTSGLIILPADNELIKKKTSDIRYDIKMSKTLCIQCNTCTELCPRNALGHNIRPHLIMRKIGFASTIDKNFIDAFLCCECGICGYYACPMGLKPVEVIKYIKKELITAGIKPDNLNKAPIADSLYETRNLPTERLISRLNLDNYYHIKAPLNYNNYEPDYVRIPLQQHIGVPATPIVKEGEKVKKNQIIATIPDNKLGAVIHSSINGKVSKILKKYIEIKK